MARAAQAWKLDLRPGSENYRVRFRHEGVRYAFSTGKSDKGQAAEEAAKIYGRTVSGDRSVTVPRKSHLPLGEIVPLWLADLTSQLSGNTVKDWGWTSDKWLARWSILGDITTKTLGEYTRERLKVTQAETVRKNRAALRNFLEWCVEREHLDAAPEFPELVGLGTVAREYEVPTLLEPEQAEKLIAALPEWSDRQSRRDHVRFRIRDYYRVLWLTGWRPETVDKLASSHVTSWSPIVRVTPNVVKDKNASRKLFGKTADVRVPDEAAKALWRCLPEQSGLLFGNHRDCRGRLLAEAAKKVLKLYVTDYDFKHSRLTQLTSMPKANINAISYLVGVKPDTIYQHYVQVHRRAADEFAASLK